MNWQYIIDGVLAVLFVVLTRYAVPVLKQYLKDKKAESLVTTIDSLVAAAEQLFLEPKSGEKKLNYVETMLKDQGVEVNDSTRALIESAVYNLK